MEAVGLEVVGLEAVGLEVVGLEVVGLEVVSLEAVGLEAVGFSGTKESSQQFAWCRIQKYFSLHIQHQKNLKSGGRA